MASHMLVLAPTAIFLIALALSFDLPQRLATFFARLRPRRLATERGS